MIRRAVLKLGAMMGFGAMPPALAAPEAPEPVSDRVLRDRFWARFGTVIDAFEVEPFNPFFAAYPKWPGRVQRFRLLARRGGGRIAYTDGLSDAYADPAQGAGGPGSGLGLELYLETEDEVGSINQGWAVNLLLELARLAVNHGALRARLREQPYLTVQLDMVGAPQEWSLDHPDGNIGIFLGLSNPELPSEVALSEGGFAPVNAKLMRPEELRYALEHGAAGRAELARLYAGAAGRQRLSDLERLPVV